MLEIQDILNTPEKILVNGKEYKIEFGHKVLGILEETTNKSIYKIYDLAVKQNNLRHIDCVELACCGLVKHHTQHEIAEARKIMLTEPSFWRLNENAILFAYAKVMEIPQVLQLMIKSEEKPNEKAEEIKKKPKTARKKAN